MSTDQYGNLINNGGAPPAGFNRRAGGAYGSMRNGWSFRTYVPVIIGVGALLVLIVYGALIGVLWNEEDTTDIRLSGIHVKNHRIFISRNVVAVYNLTTRGLSVLQGGQIIGSPTIPGSGYLIVNKRSVSGNNHYIGDLDFEIIEEDADQYLVAHPEEHIMKELSKRAIQTYRPESKYSGITFLDQSNITMNGGSIVNVANLYATNIFGSIRGGVNETTASNLTTLDIGLFFGPLPNGSIALGYAPIPTAGTPLINQIYELKEDDVDELELVRFNEEDFAFVYSNGSLSPLYTIAGALDPVTNRATYTQPGKILNTGVASLQMRACSFEGPTGLGANVIAVVYQSNIDGNLYARVCDLSVPTAPVCGPSTNVSTGDAAVNGVYVVDGSPVLNDMTCLIHPDDELVAPTTLRWVVISYTSGTGGWKMAIQLNADVTVALPGTIPRTPPVLVGIVNNLTDVSTSTDLANTGQNSIQVTAIPEVGGYFVVTWKTESELQAGKTEVDYIDTTGPVLVLTTRSPLEFLTVYQNAGDDDWVFRTTVGLRDATTGHNKIYIGYNIEYSNFGRLVMIELATPVPSGTFATSPWFYQEVSEFASDLNALDGTNDASTLSVAAVCTDQVLVTYAGASTFLLPQSGITVLVNTATDQSCISLNSCVTVSSEALITNIFPYLLTTVWGSIAQSTFDCSDTGLTPFLSAVAIINGYNQYNSSLFIAPGLAGRVTVSYAPYDVPRQVTGIITGVYENITTATTQTGGSVNVCSFPYTIDGIACPFEAPAPVYACPGGYPTFSPYCTSSNARSPGPLVGYTDIYGNVQLSV